MLFNNALIKHVAKTVYETTYRRSSYALATQSQIAEASADARTIVSSRALGMDEESAAARLATWLWIDKKQPHAPWASAPEPVRLLMLRKAHAGYAAIDEHFHVSRDKSRLC